MGFPCFRGRKLNVLTRLALRFGKDRPRSGLAHRSPQLLQPLQPHRAVLPRTSFNTNPRALGSLYILRPSSAVLSPAQLLTQPTYLAPAYRRRFCRVAARPTARVAATLSTCRHTAGVRLT